MSITFIAALKSPLVDSAIILMISSVNLTSKGFSIILCLIASYISVDVNGFSSKIWHRLRIAGFTIK